MKKCLATILLMTGLSLLTFDAQAGSNWDGGGATNLTSAAANWDLDALPGIGAAMTFGSVSPIGTTIVWDFINSKNPNSITFPAGALGYTINDPASASWIQIVQASGGGVYNNSSNTQTINKVVHVFFNGVKQFNAASSNLVLGKDVGFRTDSMTSGQTNTLSLTGAKNGTISGGIVNGNAPGSGVTYALSKDGAGTWTLAGTNSFSGSTRITAGTLFVNGSIPGTVTVSGGTLAGSGTATGAVAVDSGGISAGASAASAGTLTIQGNLNLASGAAATFDLAGTATPGGGVNDLIQLSGTARNLTLNSNPVTINPLAVLATNTPYTLMSFTGTRSGALGAVNGLGRQSVTISYDDTPGAGKVMVTFGTIAAPAGLIWNSASSSVWAVQTTSNWLNTGSADVFYQTDNVTFDDTPGVQTAVTLNTVVAPSTVTVNTSTNAFSLSGTGRISGGASLTKSGGSTLTVSNTNDYTGATTINGGVLEFAGSSSVADASAIALNGGSVKFSGGGTRGNLISGVGNLTVAGTNTLTLSSNNSYTGVTTLAAGTLSIATLTNGGVNSSIGAASSAASNLVFAGGALSYSGATASSDRSFTLMNAAVNSIAVTNPASILTLTGSAPTNTGLLKKDGAGGLTLDPGAGSYSLGSLDANGGTLTLKSGTFTTTEIYPTTVISGYSIGAGARNGGTLVVDGATLNVTGSGTLKPGASSNGNLNILSGTVNAATIVLGHNGIVVATQSGGNVTATNIYHQDAGSATYTMTGGTLTVQKISNNSSVANTPFTFIMNGGTVRAAAGAVNLFDNTGKVGPEVTVQLGSIGATIDTSLSNATIVRPLIDMPGQAGQLTKIGANALTLSATNTYTGATTVSAGTLAIEGTLTSAGTTTVSSGSTLTGSGVLSGPVVINSGGKLTPGTSGTGKMTTGALTLATTSQLCITAGAPNDPGNSQLVINGNLNLNGTLQLTATTGFTSGSYIIATYTGTYSGPGFQSITVPAGFSYSLDTTTPGQIKLRVLQAAAITPANHIMAALTDSVALTWAPAPGAVAYDVYLGTNATDVGNATPSSNGIYLGRTTAAQYTAAGFAHGITEYWRVDYVMADGSVFKGQAWDFTLVVEQDLMADTWVATDALNRVLPDAAKVGPPRSDRPIAIFYFLWHTKNSLGSDGPRDNTREINRLGGYTDLHKPWADNPLWMTGSEGRSWYWGEPEAGYYSSDDEWVIRRHIMLLVAAGVDILAFDNTNGHPEYYQAAYTKIAETIRKMRLEGMKVDLKFLFITHGGVGGSPATMTWLYENLYKPGLYPELWLMWNGKPAMVGYPDGLASGDTPVTAEVRNFFTLRTGWANGSGGPNDWQWIDTPTPQNYGYGTRPDIPEQTPVACGGWCNSNLGRSNSNRKQPAYNNYYLTPAATEGQGKFFSEQTYYGLKLDPQLLFLTGWNEWWAGAWTAPATVGGYKMLNNQCAIGQRYFVDNYNAEYSRDIEPMKGGFGDNYYYQMVAANRLRKGARPAPVASPARTITSLADFANVLPAYQDAPDETLPRNAPTTFSNLPNYTNTTGRNDFRVLKVARDASNLYFYAQTKNAITPAGGSDWMLLFLDTDQNRATGWEGYDYVINLGGSGQLQHFADSSWSPVAAGGATVTVTGNQLMITVSRASLGLTAEPLRFDFHWADNLQTLGDIADFGVSGDSAPERRFNYRYQTAPTEAVTLRSDGFESGDESAQGVASSWGASLSPQSQWKIATTTPYTGSQCLLGTGAATTTDASGALINPADTASLDSLRVAFRYKLTNVKDAQNIQIYYKNSSGQWISIRELGRDQFLASGQAWGYDERQSTWLYFSDARLNAGTDAAYFHSQFAIQIQIQRLNSTTQTLALDDFQITGTRTILAPGAATGPTPSNGATAVPSPAALSWTPGAGATTQQVYFGTPDNLVLLGSLDGRAASQLLAVPPAAGTGCVWRVDTVNAAGTTPGPVWSFTTAALPNQPPTLEEIADCDVIAGQSVAFTAIAADADSPAQTLTFGLQGAPEGAAIQPASGQFAWRPTQAQAPGAYPLAVTVTDNGSPPLTAQRAFTIHVATPATPALSMLEKTADGTFRFRVTGDAGPDYRVLISTDLVHWDLLQTVHAPNPPFLFEDPDAKNARSRFYRVMLGP